MATLESTAATPPVSQRNIIRVLIAGFSLVILLLLTAGFMGVRNVESINANSAELVREQMVTTRLIGEVQQERNAINAVFYNLGRGAPDTIDRDKVLQQLDEADEAIDRITGSSSGTPDQPDWTELRTAVTAFSVEARRLLAQQDAETLSSIDLLRRHQEVLGIVGKLGAAGYQKAVKAQSLIQQRSSELMRQSLVLLGACLLLALVCAILTVRFAAGLFRKMEWQSGELARVSWHMLSNQETIARRFSHELHDELGQSLTAVKANLVALAAAPGAQPARLDDCRALVDEAIRNVREMSQLLHPTILDDFGLDAALRSLCEGFEMRTGITVAYTCDFHGRLRDEIETHIFRIAQEALTNVARHSGATEVKVRLRAADRRVWLTIQDNGRGLSVGPQSGGIGMVGMRARAQNAGGEVTIHSPSGAGVTIEVWTPQLAASETEHDSHPVSR